MEQIQVTQLDNKHDDLFVVNAARVSFNKWSKVFHPTSDTRLINYLAREQHSSPFRHVRMAIAFQLSTLCGLPYLNFLDPFDRAGLVTTEVQWNGGTYLVMKNSLFGWANLIRKWGHLYSEFFNKYVGYQLYQHFPVSAKALGVPMPIGLLSARDLVGAYVLPEEELATLGEPWLVDVSFRCKVPIWLSRQLAKHQVGMSWNEVSRRYVNAPVELFDQEVREKPQGSIKQGSCGVADKDSIAYVGIEDDCYSIDTVMDGLRTWYDECVYLSLAPETLRGFMPQNMMTEYIWSGPLPAFAHMVNLRSEGHAQKEAQDFAKKISAQLHLTHQELWSNLLK